MSCRMTMHDPSKQIDEMPLMLVRLLLPKKASLDISASQRKSQSILCQMPKEAGDGCSQPLVDSGATNDWADAEISAEAWLGRSASRSH